MAARVEAAEPDLSVAGEPDADIVAARVPKADILLPVFAKPML
nr:hypothetical protein [Mycobacterium tuberculosis]